MSKRGLSREEKKTKMMELFHENSEFFTMKELEKNAPKQKGITQQTVKEIVDELVSDGMINMDKIGTGNYYWAFPSASGAMKTAAVTKATKELEGLKAKLSETHSAMKENGKGREDTAERRQLLAELESLNATSVELKAELEAFGAADPAKFEKKKKAVQVCKEAAGRWTDNTMILLQYACSMGAEVEMIRQVLGIGETWEDLPF